MAKLETELKAPNDPFSEPQQKLRYKLSPAGKPIFWAVGKNGTDEGGLQTGHRPLDSEDIVWQ